MIEFTKDWSYDRKEHIDYLYALCTEEPYSTWLIRNETLIKSTIPRLRKHYLSDYNKELNVSLCIDNTIDDDIYEGRNYWSDLMIIIDEEDEIEKILKVLYHLGINITEDAVYYNSNYKALFITLNRARDDNGPDLYDKHK